jgi:hypothetical protein
MPCTVHITVCDVPLFLYFLGDFCYIFFVLSLPFSHATAGEGVGRGSKFERLEEKPIVLCLLCGENRRKLWILANKTMTK